MQPEPPTFENADSGDSNAGTCRNIRICRIVSFSSVIRVEQHGLPSLGVAGESRGSSAHDGLLSLLWLAVSHPR